MFFIEYERSLLGKADVQILVLKIHRGTAGMRPIAAIELVGLRRAASDPNRTLPDKAKGERASHDKRQLARETLSRKLRR